VLGSDASKESAGRSVGAGVGAALGGPGSRGWRGAVSALRRSSMGREMDATSAAIPRTIANRSRARLRCTVWMVFAWTFGLGEGDAEVKVLVIHVDLCAEARATV
jgi:hypothetical protein